MLWKRDDPDPLEARRRLLEEQQRQLTEQKRRLTEELRQPGGSATKDKRTIEPPVWRMEDDIRNRSSLDTTPPRKRNLGRQTQRDMILFFILITLLLILGVVVWIAYVHTTTAPAAGG